MAKTLFVAAFAAILVGCAAHLSKPPCCAVSEAPAALTDQSLYQTESTWVTDQGKHVKLRELVGRPQIVVMFFANCQFACPIIVNDLKRIEAALTLMPFGNSDLPPYLSYPS